MKIVTYKVMQWWWVKAEKPRGAAPPTPSRLARRGETTPSKRATRADAQLTPHPPRSLSSTLVYVLSER